MDFGGMGGREERAAAMFADEVRLAVERGEIGRLGLLGLEAAECGWKRAGLERVCAGLARVGGPSAARVGRQLGCAGIPGEESVAALRHAIVFTGHMIDAPGRAKPRFPAKAEEAARGAIRAAVLRLAEGSPDLTVGVAGGASGGDLMFHEACAELEVKTVLRLTLPVEAFVAASVAPAGAEWVARFRALHARLGESRVQVLGEGPELPAWMGARADYDVWQRTNLWLLEEAIALAPRRTLLALWDGEPGDGPGGTQHLVDAAPRFGIEVAPPIMTTGLVGEAAD